MLRAGIVGLPNVGKSTLFNALTRTRKAEAANYPFCTIEPNVGVVTVPDARLEPLAKLSKSERIISATIEFVDIAGLVKGASQGEGLGNKFLQHIREVDAIVEVVRCFEDKDIVHVAGTLDPVADIETIQTELVLADLETVAKAKDKLEKNARGGDKDAKESLAVAEKLATHLDTGRRAFTAPLSAEEKDVAKRFFLLTFKPMLFACNVAEAELAAADASPHVVAVREFARTHLGTEAVVVSAAIEAELAELPEAEAREYLTHLGVADSGVSSLIRAAYHLLGLRTYLTAGEKETRAWTIRSGDTAPQAAGVIHTDFEKGFIKAETVSYDDLMTTGSMAAAKEKGLVRQEGKEYVVRDGDVMLFKFNV
ncbi:MAG TPA: redox-regulated ATPase YchF [Thermoanaerobaculia bacterium]|jgi:GTP-binding protein YchF|nr:redox-regulated ATPase YchF [Thermoanaerobaculia bacterium]